MARYSINIESKEPVDTVENVLTNVNWIKKAVADAGYPVDDYSFESQFNIGELSCTCDSEEELRVEALGQNTVFSNTTLNFKHDDDYIGFIISPSNVINEGKNVFISCNNKTMLSNIVALLKIKTSENEDNSASSIVINANNINSSNIVVGSGNTANVNAAPAPAKKSIWKDIWAGILKNIIWVLVVAIILIVLAYFGITKPDWLRL